MSDGAGFCIAGAAVIIALIVSPCPLRGGNLTDAERSKADTLRACMETDRTFDECQRFVEATP